MRISGMSFEKGVFFMTNQTLACSFHDREGVLRSWSKPLNAKTLGYATLLVWRSSSFWFKAICGLVILFIVVPKLLPISWQGFPFYSFFYLLFGTHFFFPRGLKQYHAAEHKVFSARGKVNHQELKKVGQASVLNRGCSTGLVVAYFLSVIICTLLGAGFFSVTTSLMVSSYISLLFVGFYFRFNRHSIFKGVVAVVLPLSYWLQERVTTKTPTQQHLECAIESYMQLGKVAFSKSLYKKRIEEEGE
ncbi:hypothetical protein BleG1_1546 [Shouchella lehensis G1]|uniref:DUF1385 domain-containing protein n=3 Tax=Shouchella lehensis TaxID=300825 RepID=A0A060M226_9BACI|nr:hypothetical protein BleG1_1546 [Shouchella lehensis G1]MBG9785750.1 hypothetical protein [Shouchella lehensis]TES48216.1 DUF1385 domain-containing protein [Shouchella lehensis]